ncbi:MAG: arylsulfatase [Pirellulales bacterium]
MRLWVLLAFVLVGSQVSAAESARPNIVLVIADDQGYGDLGHTGNPVIQTPHLDALAAESTSLTNYHVAPTCSPTRAALLTGHWTDRTGVWHTINGRSMLRENEITLGRLLADAGYATGMFGKWHLGDNFPYRPEDRGFSEVYRHGGGGVGQTPDLWDNAYFDGHYFHNGEVVPAEGFCTDVFFGAAANFIRSSVQAQQPFFAYISTNAPHGPLHCPQAYLDRYADQPPASAAFFGMISNIDDNVGSLRAMLEELGVAENTLFIFTTDNGTASGASVFNAGMRGQKGSEYDGGHRVPFMAHWPAAGWNRRHVSDRLCHAIDVVPTLAEIGGVTPLASVRWDGVSIRSLLDPAVDADWPDRMLVTDSQRVRDPVKWKQTAVMSQQWRLVNGTELYDMASDPGQQTDVAAEHPQQVAAMQAFYDRWWTELQPTFAQTTEVYVGHADAPHVSLTCHDWIGEEMSPWNQRFVREGLGYAAGDTSRREAARGSAPHHGHWAIRVATPGDYRIAVRRWPAEANANITAALPAGEDVPGASKAFRAVDGRAIPVTSAVLRINDVDVATTAVGDEAAAVFTATLTAGSHTLAPVFTTADGQEVGCYYCDVSLLERQPAAGAHAALGTAGELVLSDSFERSELGAWQVAVPAFDVADGVLRSQQAREDHGAVGRAAIPPCADLIMEFRFRFNGSPSFNVVFDDKTHAGTHAGHICRVSITPKQVRLGDDCEGIMRNDIYALRRDAAVRDVGELMTSGRGLAVPLKLAVDDWHTGRVEIVAGQMRVVVNGHPVGLLRSPGLAHPTKSSVHFTVPGDGMEFDDVRLWRVAP